MNKTILSPTGESINSKILACGVTPLIDLSGKTVHFYPPGKLPSSLIDYLHIHKGRHARLLRDYLVTLGRDIKAGAER